MPQTQRLTDLTSLLAPFVLLLGLIAATIGCSAKVEVERANTEEKTKTAIQLGLLQSRSPEPPSVPKPANSTTIINVGNGSVRVGQTPAQAQSACTMSAINTRIGFPTTYWKHGLSALVGSIAVWTLLGTAVALMLATVGRTSGGPLLSIVALLAAAVLFSLGCNLLLSLW